MIVTMDRLYWECLYANMEIRTPIDIATGISMLSTVNCFDTIVYTSYNDTNFICSKGLDNRMVASAHIAEAHNKPTK